MQKIRDEQVKKAKELRERALADGTLKIDLAPGEFMANGMVIRPTKKFDKRAY